MDKRYQVFVSSTFADLQQERSKVIQTIMELDCIPAGMEIFPAIDEEQFEFIKRIIDDCDYYLLIIGGRYGTLSEDGISYTEKEYNYAIQKGIKVMAFIHSNPDAIPLGKSEKDTTLREKLDKFKSEVSTNRLIKFWTTADELPGLVALSLSKTIKTYPATGWVRASMSAGPEVYKEMSDLRKENQELKDLLNQKTVTQTIEEKDIANLDDKINISGSAYRYRTNTTYAWDIELTWGQIFALISPYLLEHPSNANIKSTIGSTLYNQLEKRTSEVTPEIKDHDFQTIKIHFKALGLINIDYLNSTNGQMGLYWSLTELGEKLLLQLRSVKK
jgi:hypothetical protein